MEHGLPVPRAAVLDGPAHHLEVALAGRVRDGVRVPRAAVGPQPLQDLEVARLGGEPAGLRVPVAAVRAGPAQELDRSAGPRAGGGRGRASPPNTYD